MIVLTPPPPFFFSEIDPDYEYYTNLHQNGNLNCDYYYEDKFRCKLHKTDESRLSLFHLNTKNIFKHHDKLKLYMKSLEFEFSFFGLTQTWLDVDKEEFTSMTLIILTVKWKPFLLNLFRVSSIRIQIFSLGLYTVCIILQLMFSMIAYLIY